MKITRLCGAMLVLLTSGIAGANAQTLLVSETRTPYFRETIEVVRSGPCRKLHPNAVRIGPDRWVTPETIRYGQMPEITFFKPVDSVEAQTCVEY